MMHLKYFLFLVCIVVVTQVNALNVQLQLQLTREGEQVNPAKLSVAAASFLAIKHFNDREIRSSPVIPISPTCNPLSKLNVTVVDSMNDEKVALRAFLRTATPDIVVGALTSFETVPLALTASVLEVPIVSYGATSQTLDESERYSTFLRTIPSDRTVAEACCQLFASLGYEYISVLHADDEYGSAYKDAVTDSCGDLNIPIQTRAVSFRVGNVESVQDAVETLQSFESNIVVAIAYDEDVASAVSHAASIGMIGAGKLWLFTDSADTNTLQTVVIDDPKLAEVLDGNVRVLAQGTVRKNGRFTEFMDEWEAIGAGQTDQAKADLIYINEHITAATVDTKLQSSLILEPVFFQGDDSSIDPAAAYAYDAIMAAGIAECEGSAARDGLRNAMQSRKPPMIGVSGSIEFDENGSRDPNSAYFSVQNLQMNDGKLTIKNVGAMNATNGILLLNEGDAIVFPGQSSVAPLDRAQVATNYNYIASFVTNAGICMVAVLLLLIVAMLVWIYVHRLTRVVRHSQREFLVTLLIGTLISTTTIVPLLMDDNFVTPETADIACMAAPWLYSVGFVITFSALFAKTYRISRIFNNKKLIRIKITNRDLFMNMGLLAIIDCSILLAWQRTSPLRWQRYNTEADSFNRTVESLGMCTDSLFGMGGDTSGVNGVDFEGNGALNSNHFVIMLACLHVGIMVYGNVLAYRARNVPTSFQESHWIGLAVASMLQLFMIGVPVVFAVANDPTARTLVMTSVIFLNNAVLVLAVVGPKIHAVWCGIEGSTGTGTSDVGGRTEDLLTHQQSYIYPSMKSSEALKTMLGESKTEFATNESQSVKRSSSSIRSRVNGSFTRSRKSSIGAHTNEYLPSMDGNTHGGSMFSKTEIEVML